MSDLHRALRIPLIFFSVSLFGLNEIIRLAHHFVYGIKFILVMLGVTK